MKRIMLVALVLAIAAAAPARADSASCGGLSPLEVRCSMVLTPSGASVDITVSTGPTFAGVIEVRVAQGSFGVTNECVQASVVTSDCEATVSGLTPEVEATITAEVLTVDRVVGPLPAEDVTPSIGDWTVTAAG